MKKIIIFLMIVFLLIFVGCKTKEDTTIDAKTYCVAQGYVPIDDANKVVDVTNKLVDLVNLCLAEKNVTGLQYLDYWKIS